MTLANLLNLPGFNFPSVSRRVLMILVVFRPLFSAMGQEWGQGASCHPELVRLQNLWTHLMPNE